MASRAACAMVIPDALGRAGRQSFEGAVERGARNPQCGADGGDVGLLGFVHDLVPDADADAGRPSIDPVVFFEGLRSVRQFMRLVADRLSLR